MADCKRYYWLKLHDDFFDSKRIKKMRKMAGGDTYTIIYLKMQLVAMKKNGFIEWTGLEASAAEEISLDIDENPDDVKMTLAYLLSCGLAETNDDQSFFFPYSVENTGSETSSAKRVRDFRERDKVQKALHCNADVTQVKQICNGEKEKEKEKELELELEKEVTPLDEAMSAFKKHRTKLKAPMTDVAEQRIRSKLDTLAKTESEKVEILYQSIENGWKGVFPLHKEKEVKTTEHNYDDPGNEALEAMLEKLKER